MLYYIRFGFNEKKYPNFLVKYLSLFKPKIKPGYFYWARITTD